MPSIIPFLRGRGVCQNEEKIKTDAPITETVFYGEYFEPGPIFGPKINN